MVGLREYRTAKKVVVVAIHCGAEGFVFHSSTGAGSLSHSLSVAPVEGSSFTCKPRLLFIPSLVGAPRPKATGEPAGRESSSGLPLLLVVFAFTLHWAVSLVLVIHRWTTTWGFRDQGDAKRISEPLFLTKLGSIFP